MDLMCEKNDSKLDTNDLKFWLDIVKENGVIEKLKECQDIIKNKISIAKYLNFVKVYVNTTSQTPSNTEDMFQGNWIIIDIEMNDSEKPIDIAKKACQNTLNLNIDNLVYKGNVKKEFKLSYLAKTSYYFVANSPDADIQADSYINDHEKKIWEKIMSDNQYIVNYNLDYEKLESETFKESVTKLEKSKNDCASMKPVSYDFNQLKNKPKVLKVNEVYNKELNLSYNYKLQEYLEKPYRIHESFIEFTMEHTTRDYIMFMQHQEWEYKQITEPNLESFKILKYFEHEGMYYCFFHIVTKDIMRIIPGKEMLLVKAIKVLDDGSIMETFKSFDHPAFEKNPKKSPLHMRSGANIFTRFTDDDGNLRTHVKGYTVLDPKLKIGIS